MIASRGVVGTAQQRRVATQQRKILGGAQGNRRTYEDLLGPFKGRPASRQPRIYFHCRHVWHSRLFVG
ncbi:hypothetical protein OEZ86_009399 [Tetradesmus obliquus]|nr:hypothetical protein OEZ86_009399 [Tetradesmus obliquus]